MRVLCFVKGFFIILFGGIQLIYNVIRSLYVKTLEYQAVKYESIPLEQPWGFERLLKVRRKVLVLDLDETLVHSQNNNPYLIRPQSQPDFVLRVEIERGHEPVKFYVNKRPHVDYFLDVVRQWYDIVVYTASIEKYGQQVINVLDNKRGIFQRRYFRQHCVLDSTSQYTKDLTMIKSDLSSVFIIDNSPSAYKNYPDNAIAVPTWTKDRSDTWLLNLLPFLDGLRFCNDVRTILSRHRQR
ncbi:CTD nuclear envelope phosphatase 1A-like [Bolinopsis microptera]|uniref:CTD nuclear envelope phosphatase 1A-like n=1 Tax=Bolinopsis microptera TaxID=2820187 RepID=UPI003079FE21